MDDMDGDGEWKMVRKARKLHETMKWRPHPTVDFKGGEAFRAA